MVLPCWSFTVAPITWLKRSLRIDPDELEESVDEEGAGGCPASVVEVPKFPVEPELLLSLEEACRAMVEPAMSELAKQMTMVRNNNVCFIFCLFFGC
jgi:hypothetical protein